MADVALSRVTHDIVQNTYKELHALLDSLGDAEVADRRARLLDFLLKVRHRFARLLVAVRWFMSYSAFHSSASVTKALASNRTAVLTEDADTLWMVSNLAKGAAAQPSAVQAAAELLGASAFFARIPRCIEAAIGLDLTPDAADDSDPEHPAAARRPAADPVTAEAVERLSVATRYAVQTALPPGVLMLEPRVDPGRAAVRVGVPGAWTADLILDRLKLPDALLLLLRFSVLVDAHPDAPGSLRSKRRPREKSLPLPRELSEPLRQMFEDRMRWVAQDPHAPADATERMRNVLLCLSKAMSAECCGKLAMEHVRAQAGGLTSHPAWKKGGIVLTGVGSRAGDDVPVRIRYWPKSHLASSLTFTLPQDDGTVGNAEQVLLVEHNEKLPTCEKLPSLETRAINIESLLIAACRIRALNELNNLRQFCAEQFPTFVSSTVVTTGLSSTSLIVSIEGQGPALHFGMYLTSGGFFVHARHAAALALSQTDFLRKEFGANLWEGERHFRDGMNGLKNVLKSLIPITLSLLRCHSAMQKSCAIDGGALSRWPPGTASVERPERSKEGKLVSPPLMAIDRKRSKRFLSLQSVADETDSPYIPAGISAIKRARTMPMHYSTSTDGTAYLQPRRPEGLSLPAWYKDLHSAACSMADWSEIRHAADIRLRRDNLLREFEGAELATALDEDFNLKSPHRTPLKMKSQPMEIDSAVLLLLGNDAWKIQLTLTNDIFDDEVFRGQVVSYSSSSRQLTFSYPTVSAATLKCFGRDFARARTAAALVLGLCAKSKYYSIERRSPSHMALKAYGLKLTIGYGKRSIEIESSPSTPIIRTQLIPLMEEVLSASGRSMGKTLSELVERALPIGLALQSSAPSDPASFRVGFMNALRARFTIANQPKRMSCVVEIDARSGRDRIRVIDLARAVAATSGSKNRDSSSSQFKPIPVWDAIVNRIVSNDAGKAQHGGAVLVISVSLLGNLLETVVKSIQR